MRVQVGGLALDADVSPTGVRLSDGEATTELRCHRLPDGRIQVVGPTGSWQVWVDGGRAGAGGEAVNVRRLPPADAPAQPGDHALTPPMPATVARVLVEEGERVSAGQILLALGAMKTEIVLRAPHAGRVSDLRVSVGQSVRPGDRLLQVQHDPS